MTLMGFHQCFCSPATLWATIGINQLPESENISEGFAATVTFYFPNENMDVKQAI